MKKFQLFILILITNVIFAQNTRFVYDYKSIPDTLNKDKVADEIMVLEIMPEQKQSLFFSKIKLNSDSTMYVNSSKGIMTMPSSLIKTQYVIEKNLKDKKVFLYTRNHTMVPISKVEDDRHIIWKISKQKDKILSYSVQKATTSFGGRNWTAWFSTEIPFSDGPYKFSGLPGLILKISDSTNSHSFELVGVEKENATSYRIFNDESYAMAKKIPISQYVRVNADRRKDPMMIIRQKVFAGDMFFKNDNDKREYLKQTEIYLKKEIAKDNNSIELDLLKP